MMDESGRSEPLSSSANASKRPPPSSPAAAHRSVRPRGSAAADGGRGLPRQHNINDDGYFTTNRKNIALCVAYNRGECGGADNRNRCLANPSLAHQCSKCLSLGHPAINCTGERPGPPRQGSGR
eukprot:6457438-Amphidinium_carterae.1